MRNMVMAVVLGLGMAAAAPAQGDNWANKLFTFQGGQQALIQLANALLLVEERNDNRDADRELDTVERMEPDFRLTWRSRLAASESGAHQVLTLLPPWCLVSQRLASRSRPFG